MPSSIPSGFERTVLASGVRVVTEAIPTAHTASVGVWVDAGSRDESDAEGGITHFLEHMVFKGTTSRPGYLINQRMEAVGGYVNAFTSKEHTCFYAKGLAEHAGRALDTVLDLVTAPTLPAKEIEKEKDVVVEEIKMYEDTPDDQVFDLVEAAVYPGHPLGRPVIGTTESVRSFTRETLAEYLGRHYTPDRLVVAAAGAVRHADVVRLTEKLLAGLDRAPGAVERAAPVAYTPTTVELKRPTTQQAHLVVSAPAFGAHDERRTALSVLNTVLGGGMSSRLNQNVREKYGWCYSVYSFTNVNGDSGDVGAYIGTDPARVDRSRALIVREMQKLAETVVSPRMLDRARQQLKGSIVLGLESMSSRMQRLGRVELTYGREIPIVEVVDEIDAVTAEHVREVAERLFAPERLSTVVILPEDGADD
ncbi:MAG TPA: pitrilysin family protein [Rubricoccaceae bacterium]